MTSMLPYDADPVLLQASDLAREIRQVRKAMRAAEAFAKVTRQETDLSAATVLQQDLTDLQENLDQLLAEPGNLAIVHTALDERATVLRAAVQARRAELAQRERLNQAERIVTAAARDSRSLTSAERERVRALRSPQPHAGEADGATALAGTPWQQHINTAARRDATIEALGTMRLREARAQLRDGLLMTEQMRGIIAEALPSLTRGEPVLLVGETGGAKTALAEHLALRASGSEPELISGYGDITSAQVIGSHELRAENGATVSVFMPGPLLRAMAEGRPVILDEVNAMPAEFLKRLNRILQLRPGDRLGVQENAGREVIVAQGFAILATANEQTPHRYRGIDRLSSELVNRFGANGYRVHYPDANTRYDEIPTENGLLAFAAVVNERGELPSELSADEVLRAARAAFISQQVFSGQNGKGFADFVSTEREIDGRPGLDEAVLAPRTLVAVLQKVAGSAGAVTLDHALTRFVESVMHREDRRVLALILEGQGFQLG